MPYYAQARLDGTYEPVNLFLSITIDGSGVERLSVVTTRPLSLERLSEELYSHLTAGEALDVIAATLSLSGADMDAGLGSSTGASDDAGC